MFQNDYIPPKGFVVGNGPTAKYTPPPVAKSIYCKCIRDHEVRVIGGPPPIYSSPFIVGSKIYWNVPNPIPQPQTYIITNRTNYNATWYLTRWVTNPNGAGGNFNQMLIKPNQSVTVFLFQVYGAGLMDTWYTLEQQWPRG